MKRRKELKEEYPEDADGEAKLEEARVELKIMKCIAIRCHESKAVFAHSVPVKGRDEDNYVAELVATDVQFMGHVKVILKTDNEPALLALATDALLNIRVDAQKDESSLQSVSLEHSAEHESQSNGGTECGIRAIRGIFRTIKLCLEERIGQKIPPTHPLSAWLVEHAALLQNAKQVGEDGKTAWCRLRGRDFGQKLLGFAEAVMYKQPPKGPQHDVDGNMGARMFPGTMMGYSHLSNTYIVATEAGDIIKIRSVLRRPEADRWNLDVIKGLVATPWSVRAKSAPGAMELGEPVAKDPPAPEDAVPLPRRLEITMKMLDEFGTTDGCPQCMHIRSFRETKSGIAHSEACRKRIVEAMGRTDEGAARIQRQELKTTRALAERVEAADRGSHPGDSSVTGMTADEYARAAMDRWSRPMQPGRSGTGTSSGVPLSIPDMESAERAYSGGANGARSDEASGS